MLWIFFFLLTSQSQAASSQLVSLVKEWSMQKDTDSRAFHSLLSRHQINPAWFAQRLSRKSDVELPLEDHSLALVPAFPIALHAARFDVLETSDDWMRDDIYCYFFVTEGTMVSGRVSEIYKGLSRGQGFHFNTKDRILFPAEGVSAQIPRGQLIVDYGIVESDGDDIRELQKISALIVDLAALIYSSQDPRLGAIALQLRQEVKALASALLSGEHDDRLVTGTISWDNEFMAGHLQDNARLDIRRTHHGRPFLNQWKYRLTFRLLRE